MNNQTLSEFEPWLMVIVWFDFLKCINGIINHRQSVCDYHSISTFDYNENGNELAIAQ